MSACFLIHVCFSRVQVIYPSNVAAVQTCGISTVSLVLSLVYNMALVRMIHYMYTYIIFSNFSLHSIWGIIL
jgi:hypothetical protein